MMKNLHQGINSFLQNWCHQNNYSHNYTASLLGITEPVYILWENGGDRLDPNTFSRIVETVNSSPARGSGSLQSLEHEDGTRVASRDVATFGLQESTNVHGRESSCSTSIGADGTTELAPLAGKAGTALNPICPAVLARQSMAAAQRAYDALPDDADPGLLEDAETACQASENLLCQAKARSIPGLRAQIEELMNRCMLDEHETQVEATRTLFDNILAGLEGFHVARENGRPANKLA
jgi:hypothetical protein